MYYYFPVWGIGRYRNNRKSLRLYCWRYRRFHNCCCVFTQEENAKPQHQADNTKIAENCLVTCVVVKRVSQSALKAASQANWQFENQSERSSTTGAIKICHAVFEDGCDTKGGTSIACSSFTNGNNRGLTNSAQERIQRHNHNTDRVMHFILPILKERWNRHA